MKIALYLIAVAFTPLGAQSTQPPLTPGARVRMAKLSDHYERGSHRQGKVLSVANDSAVVHFEANRELTAYTATLPYSWLEVPNGTRTMQLEGTLMTSSDADDAEAAD